MVKYWKRFDNFMQNWHDSHCPWSDIILGTIGIALGVSFILAISLL